VNVHSQAEIRCYEGEPIYVGLLRYRQSGPSLTIRLILAGREAAKDHSQGFSPGLPAQESRPESGGRDRNCWN